MNKQHGDASEIIEKALVEKENGYYVLRLFVAGTTPKSIQAIKNIRQICEEHLKDRYELEVIDTYQNPDMARQNQLLALPTLIKKLPEPLRRFIGDMSNRERILSGLDIIEKNTAIIK